MTGSVQVAIAKSDGDGFSVMDGAFLVDVHWSNNGKGWCYIIEILPSLRIKNV